MSLLGFLMRLIWRVNVVENMGSLGDREALKDQACLGEHCEIDDNEGWTWATHKIRKG